MNEWMNTANELMNTFKGIKLMDCKQILSLSLKNIWSDCQTGKATIAQLGNHWCFRKCISQAHSKIKCDVFDKSLEPKANIIWAVHELKYFVGNWYWDYTHCIMLWLLDSKTQVETLITYLCNLYCEHSSKEVMEMRMLIFAFIYLGVAYAGEPEILEEYRM